MQIDDQKEVLYCGTGLFPFDNRESYSKVERKSTNSFKGLFPELFDCLEGGECL